MRNILLLFLVFSTSVLFAQPSGNGGHQIQERRAMTSFAVSPVVTIMSSSNIDLYFGSSLGIIDVVVKNKKQQIVYRKLVDTSIDNTLQLDLEHFLSGEYDLIISNKRRLVLKEEKFLVD